MNGDQECRQVQVLKEIMDRENPENRAPTIQIPPAGHLPSMLTYPQEGEVRECLSNPQTPKNRIRGHLLLIRIGVISNTISNLGQKRSLLTPRLLKADQDNPPIIVDIITIRSQKMKEIDPPLYSLT